MMILVANLRWMTRKVHRPISLLAAIVIVTAVFSALFVNDTMCVVMTPLVLEICGTLGRNPVPYLLGVAMSANIGGVATITGNPQNMMLGSLSGISSPFGLTDRRV